MTSGMNSFEKNVNHIELVSVINRMLSTQVIICSVSNVAMTTSKNDTVLATLVFKTLGLRAIHMEANLFSSIPLAFHWKFKKKPL